MSKASELTEKYKVDETVRIKIKKIEDLLKVKQLPNLADVDGVLFDIGGGSAGTLASYFQGRQVPDINIDAVMQDVDKAKKKFGTWQYKMIFKTKGLTIVPDKIVSRVRA